MGRIQEVLIPKNGSGTDWNGVIRTWTPIILAIIAGVSFLSGRLESQESTDRRARAIAQEIVYDHAAKAGHDLLVQSMLDHTHLANERYQKLNEDIAEIKADLRSILGLVQSTMATGTGP